MKIDIQIAATTPGVRSAGALPVLPVAGKLDFLIRFTNTGDKTLTVPSPATSQELLLRLAAPAPRGESWYLLNPSHMDVLGEITAPMPATLSLAPGQSFERRVDLGSLNQDRWFEPGAYEVWVDFAGVLSGRLRFATELRAESVPLLVELALGAPDTWIREQAMAMLGSVPGGPAAPPPPGAPVQAAYAGQVRRFLADWDRLRQSADVVAFFESVRAERSGAR